MQARSLVTRDTESLGRSQAQWNKTEIVSVRPHNMNAVLQA